MVVVVTQKQENAVVHQGGRVTTVPNPARKDFGVQNAVWPVTVLMVVHVIPLLECANVHMALLEINASLFVPWASMESPAIKDVNVDLVSLATI